MVLRQGDQVREGGASESGPPGPQTTRTPDHPGPSTGAGTGRSSEQAASAWPSGPSGHTACGPLALSADRLLPSGLCSRLQAY